MPLTETGRTGSILDSPPKTARFPVTRATPNRPRSRARPRNQSSPYRGEPLPRERVLCVASELAGETGPFRARTLLPGELK